MKVQSPSDVPIEGRKSDEIPPKPSGNGFAADTGAFVLDLDRGALLAGQKEIPLRPKTFALLHHLVSHPGRLISKDELLGTVWPDVAVTEDSIVQCVAELRRVLGDHDQRLIKTVQKRGYRFDGVLRVKPKANGMPVMSEPVIQKPAPAAPSSVFAKTIGTVGALAAVASACVILWLVWPRPASAPNSPPALSVVVLPFDSLDGDSSQEYLATGLTNDLSADLSRISGLFVIAPATAQALKGRDPRQVSRELQVRYVLEGSVRRSADNFRIAVQLVDGSSGTTRWAERFDRKREEIAVWQDEIVGRIANALDQRLIMLEGERATRERSANSAAFDLTVKAWTLIYAAKAAENYRAARVILKQAIELDGNATSAKAGMAWASGIMLMNGWSQSAEEDAEIARTAANEVLQVDPNNAIAYHVRGFLLRYQGKTDAAKDAFTKAVAINPNFAPGYAQLGVVELELGRPAQAIESVQRALKLSPRDPNSYSWQAFIGMAQLHRQQYAEAVTWLSRAVGTETPVLHHRAYYVSALALDGRRAEALAELSQLQAAQPSMTIARLRSSARSLNPDYLAQRERLYDGLKMAGLPE